LIQHREQVIQQHRNARLHDQFSDESQSDKHGGICIKILIIYILLDVCGYNIYNMFRTGSSKTTFTNTTLTNITSTLEKDAIHVPVSCSTTTECAWPNISFENSYLLTLEHQTYLNYFYNDTESRVLKWQLIYRLVHFS
jgi:hypothetical protein